MRAAVAPRRDLWLGYAASLAAAFGYGSGALAAKMLVDDHTSPMVATAFSLVFGTIIVAALFHRQAIADLAAAPRRAWLYMALAGLTAAWGVSFYFLALNVAPISVVAPLSSTYPLVSIVLAYVFLQRLERVTMRTVLGGVLVVGGAALVVVGRSGA